MSCVPLGPDRLAPGRILQIPPDGLFQTLQKRNLGLPGKSGPELGCVGRVSPVVSRPVGHRLHQFAMGFAPGPRLQLIQQIAQRPQNSHVLLFLIRSHLVGLAHSTCTPGCLHRAGGVLHIHPVPHLLPVAVDWDLLPGYGAQNRQRNQFFWKLVGTVVVGGTQDHRRHRIGAKIGPAKMVRRRLGSRVWAIRCKSRCLPKWRIGQLQRSVNLVCG